MTNEVKVESKCNTCKHQISETIPKEIVETMERCGTDESLMKNIYTSVVLNNSWFSCLGSRRCDICGNSSVLVWYDGCSPAGCNVISPPSAEIGYWPSYSYPARKVYVCKFCKPIDGIDNTKFLKRLYEAMMINDAYVVKCQKESPTKFP
jgi:hypothetical protein